MINRSFLKVLVVLVMTWSSCEARPLKGIESADEGMLITKDERGIHSAGQGLISPQDGKYDQQMQLEEELNRKLRQTEEKSPTRGMGIILEKIPWDKVMLQMTPKFMMAFADILQDFSKEGIDLVDTITTGKAIDPMKLAKVLDEMNWSELLDSVSPELWGIIGQILQEFSEEEWQEIFKSLSDMAGGLVFSPKLMGKIFNSIPWPKLLKAMTPRMWDVVEKILDNFSFEDLYDNLELMHEGKMPHLHTVGLELAKIPWHELLTAMTPELLDVWGTILDGLPWVEIMDELSEYMGYDSSNKAYY